MSIHTLAVLNQQPNGVTYADPEKPTMTVRFKTTSAPKMLDGLRTQNYVFEVISNDIADVNIGNVVVPDALSVRIRVSGSIQSQGRVAQMLRDLTLKMDQNWIDENVLTGFAPVTPPINTVV